LRTKTLHDIKNTIQWIPTWGENRIYSMVEARPDWCISRQRIWGVPIIALHCKECHRTYNEPEFIHRVAEAIAHHPTGSDIWYERSVEEIIEEFCPGLECSCGSTVFTKEMDILDVWFDSACSCYAVLQSPEYHLSYPANLYLEGSDQHRGWFHSSLLLSEAVFNTPPYQAVMTHGYVVDGKGYKMSKSVGNVIAPEEIISRYGVEIIRLWVASIDYKEDIRISDEIIARLLEAYRRIRNTCRFMLGNLSGFTKDDCVDFSELDALDRYAIATIYEAHKKIQEAYTSFEFHKCYQILHGICITELSALYFDIIKERLYLSGKTSKDRRSAQTALYYILQMVVSNMSPILSFTAEEIWQHIRKDINSNAEESVFLEGLEGIKEYALSHDEQVLWQELLHIRSSLTKALEPMRSQGTIGHSFDVDVVIYCENPERFEAMNMELRIFFIVSSIILRPYSEKPESVQEVEKGIAFEITPAQGQKCERCWVYSTECGTNPEHPSLCMRCTSVVLGNDT
ncbi:MAG: class I tRNA ligase family protein, partial [Desulfovibrionaceae bacterium]|nr:class I tRNA ligase family protein [Desulfovibrionaceae bacterium]